MDFERAPTTIAGSPTLSYYLAHSVDDIDLVDLTVRGLIGKGAVCGKLSLSRLEYTLTHSFVY